MRTVTKRAYGKINIALDITGKREDGYHLVDMLMQTVELHDTLTFEERSDEEVRLLLEYDRRDARKGDSAAAGTVPIGKDNLVFKAVESMREGYGIRQGMNITLVKRLPAAAGMAGGSADAAATLLAMRDLFDLPCSIADLEKRAVLLGADVPYCLTGGTMRAQGIGEILTPLPAVPDSELVIIKPDFAVCTAWAYREIDGMTIKEHPNMEAIIKAEKSGNEEKMWALADNVLELATGTEYPVIGELEEELISYGARRAMMTGSGPTVFGVFDESIDADRAYDLLRKDPNYNSFAIYRTALHNVDA